MRTKRDIKIPLILEDYVHSIKSNKNKNINKNKAQESVNKSNMNGIDMMDGCKNGENRERVIEESSKGDESIGNRMFVDLNSSQPPKISEIVADCGDECGSEEGEFQDKGVKGGMNVDGNEYAKKNDVSANISGSKDYEAKSIHNGDEVNSISKKDVWNLKFVDVVKANRIENRLMQISTENSENGNDVVVLDDEMIEDGCVKWRNTVCGFFVGGQVTYNEARYHLRRMWNQFGYIDLMKNEGGVFFFKFQDEKGMEDVISKGPWLVNNKPLFVQKWRVGMVLDRAEPKKLPIWVKLINVPMEAWSIKGISALASSIGKPLIMDDMTARMCAKGEGRINFARVLIEVDAGKVLKKEIDVIYKGNIKHEKFSMKIQVEYAWKPPCCDECKVFGHDNMSCRANGKKNQEVNKEQIINDNREYAERSFNVVQNRKRYYENGRDRKSYNNGYAYYRSFDTQRYYCNQKGVSNGNGNNAKWVNKKKYDKDMNNSVGDIEVGRINKDGSKNNVDKVAVEDKSKNEGTTSTVARNKECISNPVHVMDDNSYNRFTLLNELVNEGELIPSIEDRKIVDEFMNKEEADGKIEVQGWNKEMMKYYKDRKGLFDAAKEMEVNEDVEEIRLENEAEVRKEEHEADGNILE